MTQLTDWHLSFLAPNARSSYRTAFEFADETLSRYAINKTSLRLAHFMAQILHESAGLTLLIENLNYRAERLRQVWPSRFPTFASTYGYAHNPRALANKVYGGRMGNNAPDDGWRYRGRGLLQLTGRDSYAIVTLGLDGSNFVTNPDSVLHPTWSLHVAGVIWSQKRCNLLADQDNIVKVTRAINGGQVGISDRRDWLAKTKHIWPTL